MISAVVVNKKGANIIPIKISEYIHFGGEYTTRDEHISMINTHACPQLQSCE